MYCKSINIYILKDRLFAIVDIETTGSFASANGITEIAIYIHDGKEVVEKYQQLINPGCPIPDFIQTLTGISNEMVTSAPDFLAVAEEIYLLLHDKIFVAHNVNFDYSFVNYHLQRAGYQLQNKKLCTIRLARKIFPGLPGYGLGKLSRHFNISNNARHRAGGDAEATATLFSMLLKNDADDFVSQSLKVNSSEQLLPNHLPKDAINKLPQTPGVYYFKDKKHKIIYIGKAKNIKRRVISHFSGNNSGIRRQEFIKQIYHVDFKHTGSEFFALVFETLEIKHYWPVFNYAQKRFEQLYGIYQYEDQNGFLRLAVGKKVKYAKPVFAFGKMTDAVNRLKKLVEDFNLHPDFCFISKNKSQDLICVDETDFIETPESYNKRVIEAIAAEKNNLPTFIIHDDTDCLGKKGCLLMIKGVFYGYGHITNHEKELSLSEYKTLIKPALANDFVKQMVLNYSMLHTEKVIYLQDDNQSINDKVQILTDPVGFPFFA